MTARKLAIAPAAAMLALIGAAPATPSAQELVECRVPHEAAFAALKALPATTTQDESHAPGRDINRNYAVPAGMAVFGFTPGSFDTRDSLTDDRESMTIMATLPVPYDDAVAAALKGHGQSECVTRSDTGRASCLVYMRQEGEWTVGLAVLKYGDESGIACGYIRKLH